MEVRSEVPTHHIRSAEGAIRTAIDGGEPFKVVGWRTVHDATNLLAQLRAEAGRRRLAELQGKDSPVFGARNDMFGAADYREMSFAEFLDRFSSGDRDGIPYLTNVGVRRNFPRLFRHVEVPGFFLYKERTALGEILDLELFLGFAGSFLGKLHFDNRSLHAVFYQVLGTKKYVLLSPDDSRHLYRYRCPHTDFRRRFSPVVFWDEEKVARYPELDKAHPYVVTLGPEEILFCPAGWWHDTFNVTANVSLASRFVSDGNRRAHHRANLLRPPRAALKFLDIARKAASAGVRGQLGARDVRDCLQVHADIYLHGMSLGKACAAHAVGGRAAAQLEQQYLAFKRLIESPLEHFGKQAPVTRLESARSNGAEHAYRSSP